MSDLFIPPGAGRAVELEGFGIVFKIFGSQNGGLFSVVEHPMAPGVLAAPMHTHTYEDEMSFVLEGEIKALIGEELILAPAGSYVFKPRGIPHTFWNPSNRPGARPRIDHPGWLRALLRGAANCIYARQPTRYQHDYATCCEIWFAASF
jgi:quercetin dioxygenase-like cupin family protein